VVLHVGNAPIPQGPGGSNEDLVLFKVEIRLLETDPRMRPGKRKKTCWQCHFRR